MEAISTEERVSRTRQSIENFKPGRIYNCPGYELRELCSDPEAKDQHDCSGCGAMNLVSTVYRLCFLGGGRWQVKAKI